MSEVKTGALSFLREHLTLTMATASKDGIPNATPHEYASDDWLVFVEISRNHVAVQNLRENPWVHYEIHDSIAPGTADSFRVLQILASGVIYSSESSEFDEYWNKLESRFPYMKMFPKDTRVVLAFEPKEGTLIELSRTGLRRNPLRF
ncbi:MAG: pyridoxamine 5'-phosphate oxidase family protein [Candidatus Thorarchaeota archaeon]